MTDKAKRLSLRRYQLTKKSSFIHCCDTIEEFADVAVVTPFDDCKVVDNIDHDEDHENEFDNKFKLSNDSDSDSSSSESDKECKTDRLSRSISQSLSQFIQENGFIKTSSLKIRLSGSVSNFGSPRSARTSKSDKSDESEKDVFNDSKNTSPQYSSPSTPLTGRIMDISSDDSILRISIQQD